MGQVDTQRPNVAAGQQPRDVAPGGLLIYDTGGIIDEPVVGRGAWTGKTYVFAANGEPEQVTPVGDEPPATEPAQTAPPAPPTNPPAPVASPVVPIGSSGQAIAPNERATSPMAPVVRAAGPSEELPPAPVYSPR